MDHAGRLARFHESDLYVVVTEAFCGGRPAVEVLDGVLEAGVTLVQFREKDRPDDECYARALEFRNRTREAGALLIIDDRLDIALGVGADGVHLGRSDLPLAVARGLAPDLLIGASTHSLEEAIEAEADGADVANIGPIFATQTKEGNPSPVGPGLIESVAPKLSIPLTCMGGIKLGNIGQVLDSGARHVAVVTAVTQQPDVADAARALRQAMAPFRP